MCVYCRSSLFSPNPSQYYVDGVPKDAVEGYPGQRKRHKITQLASHTKPGAKSRMLLLSATTQHPVNVAEYLAEQILPKLQNFHYHCNFHLFIVFWHFSVLGTRRVWAWLNHHQVRLPFFTVNDELFFFFSFLLLLLFFSCNHHDHHIRRTGKWKADLNDLEWFVRNQQTMI